MEQKEWIFSFRKIKGNRSVNDFSDSKLNVRKIQTKAARIRYELTAI